MRLSNYETSTSFASTEQVGLLNDLTVRAKGSFRSQQASKEQTDICETVIHDQHLQHQGWQAVVANLEDAAIILEKRRENLNSAFQKYLLNRERYGQMIDTFDDDVAILHRIPVFPCLLETETTESMVGSIIPNQKQSSEPVRL